MNKNDFFLNDFSREIWNQNYKYHEDKDITDTWRRVARGIAGVEKDKEAWENEFFNILKDFAFVPGGRILANAGTEWKASYINCFVKPRSKFDIDSIEGIISVLQDQCLTLKSEGGWGSNFSFIRPRGSFIKGVGVESPGAVKYMELFDKSSEIITAGSGRKTKEKKSKNKIRKGAMMGVLDCWHPDIEEFITSKQNEGRLSKFNISVGCYDDFMEKVIRAKELKETLDKSIANGESEFKIENDDRNFQAECRWDLIFPDTDHPAYKDKWFGDIYSWKEEGFPVIVYKTVNVLDLWDLIMRSTYNRNDPGVLYLDRANKTHCWNYGEKRKSKILETNPCGEQALPDAGCCNLGSLNLTQFINSNNCDFDYEKLSKFTKIAVRFLDNVNSTSYSPLPEYKDSMENLRRIGLGVMGWGSALYLLKLRFGSDEALKTQEKLMQSICFSAIEASIDLAKEKGAFKYCDPKKHSENYYFKQIELPEKYIKDIAKYGIRNSSLFSIQPTGNTGILANNVSGGLEPIFMHEYIRTSICPHVPDSIKDVCPKYWEGEFKETGIFKLQKEGTDDVLVGVGSDGITYKIDKNRGLTRQTLCEDYAVKRLKEIGEWDATNDWAATTTSLTPAEHINDMKGFAKYIDSACSKTINLPKDYPFDKFVDIYLDCYKTGYIKGFTTYRDGTMTSVLSSADKSSDVIHLNTNTAPKRPKSLDAEIFPVTARGEKYIVAVGILNGQPYEIFGGKANGFNIKKESVGQLVKVKRGQYALVMGDIEIDDFSTHFSFEEQTIFRMASTMMRHGVPLEFIVEQMRKSTNDMFSLPSAVARVLKKYIKDGQKVKGEKCPECESENLVYQEGCKSCKDCGWTACK